MNNSKFVDTGARLILAANRPEADLRKAACAATYMFVSTSADMFASISVNRFSRFFGSSHLPPINAVAMR